MISPAQIEDGRRFAVRPRNPFRGDLLSTAGLVVLVVLLVVAVLRPFLPLGSPTDIGDGPRLASPSWQFPFGTDTLGRSMLPRVEEALGKTFLASALAVTITTAIAVLLGTLAGYKRGALDAVIGRMSDILFAFPAILLGLLIVTVTGPGETGTIIAVVLITLPLMTRVVRGAALGIADREFIVSAEVSGASVPRVTTTHLFPNVAGAVAIQMSYALSVAMLVESGLSFLGLGIQPPAASLGSLVYDGIDYMTYAPWLILIPGALLALAILSVNLVGDGLRDRFEPQEPRSLR
jgi:peptide/nickel transport system permease protein